MKLVSVNVSLPREVPHRDTTVTTGIFKEPVQGRVRLRVTNLEGDGQAEGENHGGIYLEQTTHIGDVFRIGDALVEVTQPRAPRFKLALRIGEGRLSIWKVNHLRYFDPGNLEDAREVLRVKALPPHWRSVFEERLGKAGMPIEADGRQAADRGRQESEDVPPRP